MNEILTWFAIIWFKSDINISQALLLYSDLKDGLKNYKSLMKESISGKVILGMFNSRFSNNRFWILSTTGLIIPVLLFLGTLILNPEGIELLTIFFIIFAVTYLLSLGILWKMSKGKITLVRSAFRLLFIDQTVVLGSYWEDKFRSGLKAFDSWRKTKE